MMLRLVLAGSAMVTACLLAAPTLALQSVTIPNPALQSNPDSDPVFDKSMPDTWQSKSTDSSSNSSNGFGNFHFSVSGSNGNWGSANGFGPNPYSPYGPPPFGSSPKTWQPLPSPAAAGVPGSEFYQPMPGYTPY